MSRIGKLAIVIPEGVTVSLTDAVVTVKGPKGELTQTIPEGVVVDITEEVVVSITSDDHKNLWGLIRTLIFNMVEGVTT
jgi:large subunit ribosomal protein L6